MMTQGDTMIGFHCGRLSETLLTAYDGEQNCDSFRGVLNSLETQIRLAQLLWLDGQLEKILPRYLYEFAHDCDLNHAAQVFEYFSRHKIHLEREGMNINLHCDGNPISQFQVTLKMEAV